MKDLDCKVALLVKVVFRMLDMAFMITFAVAFVVLLIFGIQAINKNYSVQEVILEES